jgi:hypothetical protein
VLRSGRRRRVEEWTGTALRRTETTTTLRGMAKATVLREGWQRKNVGLQKHKGLGGEDNGEREHDGFFCGEYAGIFEVFFYGALKP